jgi:Na+-driven multidrug efflux pump
MRKGSVKKQERLRELIISGNMWKAIFVIVVPLILYNYSNYLYGIYDTITVSINNIGSVDDIVILSQINNMISTLGGAYTVGGAIIIARKYGAGFYEDAKKTANNLFFSAIILSAILIFIFIPFGIPFLKLLATPDSVINNSINYYYIQILTLSVVIMNNTFIAIEKSKGNTKNIMLLNIGVIVIKVGLTTFFVYSGLFNNVNATYLATSTLLAQLFLLFYGLFILFNKNNVFKISFKYLKQLSWVTIKPIIVISIPIFVGKFLFSFGKVYVNSQAAIFYSSAAVGALGISNTIAGAVTNITSSIEDGTATIISQNIGNHKEKRAIDIYKKSLLLCILIGLVGTTLITIYARDLAVFFAQKDPVKQEMINRINYYERFSIVMLGIEASSLGLLYGFGKTKFPMLVSMMRLFAFRIPPLLFMYHVLHVGYESTGIAMMVSNASSGLLALIIAIKFIRKRKVDNSIDRI